MKKSYLLTDGTMFWATRLQMVFFAAASVVFLIVLFPFGVAYTAWLKVKSFFTSH